MCWSWRGAGRGRTAQPPEPAADIIISLLKMRKFIGFCRRRSMGAEIFMRRRSLWVRSAERNGRLRRLVDEHPCGNLGQTLCDVITAAATRRVPFQSRCCQPLHHRLSHISEFSYCLLTGICSRKLLEISTSLRPSRNSFSDLKDPSDGWATERA